MTATEPVRDDYTNGAAMAAFLAVGIGSFALGLLVILHEIGIFTVPTLYEPAGGVSGRTTVAAIIWLIAWALLHNRWRRRQIDSRRIHNMTLVLIVVGLILAFPPVWQLL